MAAEGVIQAFLVAPDLKPLLFQTNGLVPFSKGTRCAIFTITLPTWSLTVPVWQPQSVAEKFMITNDRP